MEYVSALEASAKWGVSLRQVQRLLAEGRVPRAKKYGRSWMIPADAGKPADPRGNKSPFPGAFEADLVYVLNAAAPLRVRGSGADLNAGDEERLRPVCEAELAYLRGDFLRVMVCYAKTAGDDALRLRACPPAIASAISLGDYRAYTEIETYLKNCAKADDGGIAAVAELSLAIAAVSCIAPNMAPDWLKAGDLSALPPPIRPTALYLRAKYFSCTGQFEAMLAVAETALSLSASQRGVTHSDIYLRLMCAVACRCMGREDEARQWLLEAMRIALPHGFTTPFSELVTALGGLMEQCLERDFPCSYDIVIGQWKRTWKNWMAFHNRFTKDNITSILSLREYHIAVLAANRVPYAKIAQQHCICVGRLKNIMQGIYAKLSISGREELASYVL